MRSHTQTKPQSSFTPVQTGILQRKCASWGQHVIAGGECSECQKKRSPLQRRARSQVEHSEVPPIVNEVLRSPGQPLDRATRTFMESRFERDFSGVRVHTDMKAAESARKVNASAYTVKQDLVFGEGQYAPETSTGKRLLAHELTHTIQQGTNLQTVPSALKTSDWRDSAEQEAEAVSKAVMESQYFTVSIADSPDFVRRNPDDGSIGESLDAGVGDPHRTEQLECVKRLGGCSNTRPAGIPTPDEIREYNAECREETSYTGLDITPTSAECAGRSEEAEPQQELAEEEPLNKVGHPLSERDRTNAARGAGIETATGLLGVTVQGARFVVHDTAAAIGAARIREVQGLGRRSAGSGPTAYVPRTGAATVAHIPLFGSRRPTATEFEKGEDIMREAQRNAAYRRVWRATSRIRRLAVLDALLAAQGSTGREATSERRTAISELNASSGNVHSAGIWTVENICEQVIQAITAQAAMAPTPMPLDAFLVSLGLADSVTDAQELEQACMALAPLTATRTSRIGSSVNVEIIQERGSDCRTTGSLVRLPAYTDSQYENTMRLYLRATLEAGVFPEITTHFWIDKNIGDHCDPRCFNLSRLYDLIRVALHHRQGSLYGIVPNYGTGAAHNVWWHNLVCGGAPPTT